MFSLRTMTRLFLGLQVFHALIISFDCLVTFRHQWSPYTPTISGSVLVVNFLATIAAILGFCCTKYRSKFLTAYGFFQGLLLGGVLGLVIYGLVESYLSGTLYLGIFSFQSCNTYFQLLIGHLSCFLFIPSHNIHRLLC
jgi:hypothetical protein